MLCVVVSLLHSVRFLVRSRAALHLEVIALRHQLAVVKRSRRERLRLTSADRMLWAWLSRAWRGWRSAIHIVTPETVVAWHRRGFRLFWTWTRRQRTGRPGIPPDVRDLIRELSTANPLWGSPRIHGELQKLGISVGQSTVAKYMRRHPRPASQTWRTFLTNHASQITAADLFVVPTITFCRSCSSFSRTTDDASCSGRHGPSHYALDCAAVAQRIPRQRRTPLSPARWRCGIHRCRHHDRRDEHRGRSHRSALAVAKRVRGTSHRVDPTRVPGSHHRAKCCGTTTGAHAVRRLLHAVENTSCAGRTRRSRVRWRRHRPAASSLHRKWAGSITATIASRRSASVGISVPSQARHCPAPRATSRSNAALRIALIPFHAN